MQVELLHNTTRYCTYSYRYLQTALLLLLSCDNHLTKSVAVLLHYHIDIFVVDIFRCSVISYIRKGELVAFVHVEMEFAIYICLNIHVAATHHNARQCFALLVGNPAANGTHVGCLNVGLLAFRHSCCFCLQAYCTLYKQGNCSNC